MGNKANVSEAQTASVAAPERASVLSVMTMVPLASRQDRVSHSATKVRKQCFTANHRLR